MAARNLPGGGDAQTTEQVKERVEEVTMSAEGDAKQKKFVHYTGDATNRIISKKDWKSIGIEADTVEWNFANNFKVESSNLTADQSAYLLNVDGRFKAVDK